MSQRNKRSIFIKIIIITLFALSLSGFRFLWIYYFQHEKDQPLVQEGKLDLRNWDFSEKGTVTMSGDWIFYPYQLYEDIKQASNQLNKKYIKVPGDWSEQLNENKKNPYGYGVYHLQIKVDQAKKDVFNIRVPSVRSASVLYVNGEHFGSSGKVSTNEQDAHGRNIPYTSSTVRPDEKGTINLYIEASNFHDPRASGLIRSIQFGLEQDIVSETNFSTLLQISAGIIYFVHALFALIIYFIGIRDRRLLYFSFIVILLTVINLTYGDEKVLYQYITIDYGWTLKGSVLIALFFCLSLLLGIRTQIDQISRFLLPIVASVYGVLIVVLIALPIDFLNIFNTIAFYVMLGTVTFALLAYFVTSKKVVNSLPVILAIIAIMNHFLWFFYLLSSGIKVVHYPFDLIIAVICIGIVWFQHYYDLHQESLAFTEKLKIMDQAKDEFLANTSHELRNPLHSILNISDAVLQREKQSLLVETKKDLETIVEVSKRMSLMVNELMDIAVIESGSPKLQRQTVSLKAVASGVIDMVTYSTEGKPITITNHIPDELPHVYADENRLVQIMFNLVHNAIKYTEVGEIVIDGGTNEKSVYISVRDTGVGIDEATIKNIFNRYVQGMNANTIGEGGFGIGLYITKQLVELHGGTLSVESTVGEGSSFTFSLPIAKLESLSSQKGRDNRVFDEIAATVKDGDSITLVDNVEAKVPSTKDRPRIIVVDDEKVNLRVIETVLSHEKYDITSVLTAQEVLNLVDEREWDLIIADVMMPNMSGYELTETLRKRFSLSELPILLVTARSSKQDLKAGFASGANDYITKPIDAIELRSRVFALTSVRQSMRERLSLESAWLQAQIKPHFLFNTLNSIIALSQFDTERMTETLNAFSDILRAKFNFDNLDDLIPITHEVDLIQSYAHIEQVRFGDRLQVQMEIEDNINILIPTLSIQPLVENAINHGVMQRDEGGIVNVNIKTLGDYIKVTVKDDGVGIEEKKLQQILSRDFTEDLGVGLINIHLRLRRLFGEGLTIESTVGEGTTVSFKVPNSMSERK